ncbi:MAG: TlpA family protein disulfide reductase [Flavipsychrobacter sp.]
MKAKLLLFLCLLATTVDAQQLASIEIGKACPDYDFRDMLDYKSAHAKVSDFKGKILILDFYATYCGPCIEQFPKLDSIQHKYGKQVQVLLVGYEKKERIESLFKRVHELNKSFILPSAVIDKDLFNKFLRKDGSIGGDIIISSQGIVLGRAEQVDMHLIETLLEKGSSPRLDTKDTTKAQDNRLLTQNLKNPDQMLYRSFVRRYDSTSLDRLSYIKLSKGEDDYGQLNFWNFTSVQLFAAAYGKFKSMTTDDGQTFILSSPYPGNLIDNETGQLRYYLTNDKNINQYRAKYDYCYDLVMQHANEKQLTDVMKQDLERTFKIKAALITKSTHCLVLKGFGKNRVKTGGAKAEYEKDNYGIKLINQPVHVLIDCLSYYLTSGTKWKLIVDELSINYNIDIAFTAKMGDINAVNTELKKFNLQLIDTNRPEKVLRLTESK